MSSSSLKIPHVSSSSLKTPSSYSSASSLLKKDSPSYEEGKEERARKLYEYSSTLPLPTLVQKDYFVQCVTCWGGSDPLKLFRTFMSFTHILQNPVKRCVFDDTYQFVIRIDNMNEKPKYRFLYYKDKDTGVFKQFLSDKPFEGEVPATEKGVPAILYKGEDNMYIALVNETFVKSPDTPDWVPLTKDNTSVLIPSYIPLTECFFYEEERDTYSTLMWILKTVSIRKGNVHLLTSQNFVGASIGRTCLMNYVYNVFKKNFVVSFCDDDDVHAPLQTIGFGSGASPYGDVSIKDIIASAKRFIPYTKTIPPPTLNLHDVCNMECILACSVLLGNGHVDNIFSVSGTCGMWRYLIPWKMFELITVTLSGKNNKGEDYRFLFENIHYIKQYTFIKYWYAAYGNKSDDSPDKELDVYLLYRDLLRRSNVFLKTGKKIGTYTPNEEIDRKIENDYEYKGKKGKYTSYAYNLLRE